MICETAEDTNYCYHWVTATSLGMSLVYAGRNYVKSSRIESVEAAS
jgi:hypothetical protein